MASLLVASHHWLCLSTVALSAPLLSAQWYTHKKNNLPRARHRLLLLHRGRLYSVSVFFHHRFSTGCSWVLSAAVEQSQSVTCTYITATSRWHVVGARKMFSFHFICHFWETQKLLYFTVLLSSEERQEKTWVNLIMNHPYRVKSKRKYGGPHVWPDVW